MTGTPENPFTNRGTIKNEDGFVGRETEINNILSRVRNGIPCQLLESAVYSIGDRQIILDLVFSQVLRVDEASLRVVNHNSNSTPVIVDEPPGATISFSHNYL